MGTRDTTIAILFHLKGYVTSRDDQYINLAGSAITQSFNQRLTLNRVARFLVERDDIWLDSMVRAMTQTPGVIAFNMRAKVRNLRVARA